MLTVEQIYNISSRDLDKLVAEIIFDWTSIGQWDHLDEKSGDLICDDEDWVGIPPWGVAKEIDFEGKKLRTIDFLPYYSNKIEDAETIILHLRNLGYDFELQSVNPIVKRDENYQWRAVFYDLNEFEPTIVDGVGYVNYVVTDIENKWKWPANGETIPLAICRAGLFLKLSKTELEKEKV